LTYTWSKDSHGLFDYESDHLFTGKFKITGQGQFYRNNNDIYLTEENTVSVNSEKDKLAYLFDVHQDLLQTERYFLSINNSLNTKNGAGLVVRGLKKDGQASGYELKVGDCVKVGRLKLMVKEIRDKQGVIHRFETIPEINFYENKNLNEDDHTNSTTCRICLMGDISEETLADLLIKPCKCRGSCEYTHLRCLKQWISMKQTRIENNSDVCFALNCRKLSCEICKTSLPYLLKVNDQEVNLVDLRRPETEPYILLEKAEDSKENKVFYLIKASEEETRIGRGHANSMLVSDISVSRNHASIIYKDGKFLIFDKNSKFGTLVQVNQPIELSEDKTIIQCGKTVVILSLKREQILSIPKVVREPMEILESPETSSTTNEADGDSKTRDIIEKPKLKGSKRKATLRRKCIVHSSSKTTDVCNSNESLSETTENSKLLLQSKKIFKVMRRERFDHS